MSAEIWIRRDKETGREKETDEKYVRDVMRGRYEDINEAMAAASEKMPITTGFADYWPKEGRGKRRKVKPRHQ